MRILIVGVGAVGGYFGAELVAAGRDVNFLARGQRVAQLRTHGLTLMRPQGATTTRVRALTAAELTDPYDLVLLAVKADALVPALDDIAQAVAEHTRILPLLNGIRHIETIRERFGGRAALGGVGLVATQLDARGRILMLAPGAHITYGELDGNRTPMLDRIAAELSAAEIDHAISSTIEQDMWEKWFFMAAGATTTVLLGGPVGRIVAEDDGRAAITATIAEIAAVFERSGHPIRAEAMSRVTNMLTMSGSPFTTSLYRDFVDGRGTEVETILGDLLTTADRLELQTPLLRAATVRLRVHATTLASATISVHRGLPEDHHP
ncbi:ketopantoate reductase family protein [Nocardia sp. NPDC050630]|uniref:ketopantoate reductase family protein n=1 Tax=Nocardia sp. NPDC050630 TaxID=3364321 RepID=UPI00379441E0